MGELVDLLSPILWHTARSQGLSEPVAEDVMQTAWLRLVDNADRINDSRRVLAWLMTTVKREAWTVSKRRSTITIDLDSSPEPISVTPTPEMQSVVTEEQGVLWSHVQLLSERCQHLLRVIAFSERPDYAGIATALGMPVGSIGPTRGRCLNQLRQSLTSDAKWGDHRA